MNSKTTQGTVKLINLEMNGTVLKHVSRIVNEAGDKFNLSIDFANGITKIEGLNG